MPVGAAKIEVLTPGAYAAFQTKNLAIAPQTSSNALRSSTLSRGPHRVSRGMEGNTAMTQRQNWLIGVCLVLACIAWATQCDRWKHRATSATAYLSWNSSEMRALEKEWQAIRDMPAEQIPGADGKTKYCEQLRMVERLFRNRLSEQNVYQLAGSCDALPVRAEDRVFEESVLAFLVKVLVELGDREALVRLLSTRSPTWFDGIEPIECRLVVRGERLKDAILILGDAYSRCEVAEARHTLAAAVRRGFASFDVGGWGDADYVKNAMQWYEKEKGRMEPNPQYVANKISPIKHPLFKEKAGPANGRSGGQWDALFGWICLHPGDALASIDNAALPTTRPASVCGG
jgi:hypothetical protein